MFTSIVVPPAVLTNESDLAPVLEEVTCNNNWCCHKAGGDFLPGSESSPLFLCQRKESSVRTPFAHDLPLFRVECASRPGIWEGSSAQRGTWSWWQLDRKAWEAGSCTHPHLVLSSRKWGARDAVLQFNHHGTSGVHPLPSGFKVTNPPHGILYFPGISTR